MPLIWLNRRIKIINNNNKITFIPYERKFQIILKFFNYNVKFKLNLNY